jgi:hypothetical protein
VFSITFTLIPLPFTLILFPFLTYTVTVHTYTVTVHTYTVTVHTYTVTIHTYNVTVHTYNVTVHTYTVTQWSDWLLNTVFWLAVFQYKYKNHTLKIYDHKARTWCDVTVPYIRQYINNDVLTNTPFINKPGWYTYLSLFWNL